MDQKLRPFRLVPSGFIVDHIALTGDYAILHVRAATDRAHCPACSAPSRQVQSRYIRHVADLPLGGRQMALSVTVRRFRCKTVSCGRQIFAGRFPEGTLATRARRTGRLDQIVHHRNAATLWRSMRHRGFQGSLRVVTEWATRRRRAERLDLAQLARVPSARTLARLMTTGRATLTKAEAVMVAAIEEGVPSLVEAREVIMAFQAMIRAKDAASLSSWLERAAGSLVASLGKGVSQDRAAVRAGLGSLWSNGQTEGQITKLKPFQRQMYGRAKIDLLEARLIGAA
jgi:transposase